MLDTLAISGDDDYCSVVFGTLVGVFVFNVMWSEFLLLVVSCGHPCTSTREWSVRSHLRGGLSVVCLLCTVCSVVCPLSIVWMCCLKEVYAVLQL